MLHPEPRPDPDVTRDLATIAAVPAEYLSGAARTALVNLARVTNAYVYTPLGADWGRANVWIQALADARPGDRDGRVQLAAWRDCWQTILGVIAAGQRRQGVA